MSKLNRRDFLKLTGVAGASVLGTFAGTRSASAAIPSGISARVIVVGGGFGGATCAKYLRRGDANIQVTLIEPSTKFVTCPFSNYVLGGFRTLDSITHGYDTLATKHGVNVIHDTVTAIDPAGKKVTLAGGKTLTYDKLVLSPGIDFKWGAIKGYDEAAAEIMPHAWKAGPQTTLLRKQLEAMRDGGVFLLVAPPNPFRCPPGPYERASMVAHYFKQHKPKSKIIILDFKENFSKEGLFKEGWAKLYPGMIEVVPGSKGGKAVAVDVKNMIVDTDLEKHKGDVVNVIPPQSATSLVLKTGLANETGFCPVSPGTFESTIHKGIHVIGDASIAGAMPKSGFAANSQGKMAAAAIVAELRGDQAVFPSYVNTCYSLLSPDYGISVAGIYRVTEKGITEVPGAGGVSPKGASDEFRKDEAKYALGWYASISADIWDT
jgi:sulfide dehydrogenase [flavocytochrome c] flavoprotein subunit